MLFLKPYAILMVLRIFSNCCKEPFFFCHLLTVILGPLGGHLVYIPSILPLHTHSVLTLIFVISSYSYRSKASVTPVSLSPI